MPVKRRVAKTHSHRITPEAIAAFRAGDHTALNRALGIRPWETCPLDAYPGPCPSRCKNDPYRVADWRQAQQLRRELERA